MTIFNGITDTIGRTPVIRLKRVAPEGVNLYVKLESFNPGGSVKDRMSKYMVEKALASGALKPGQTVVEATSGNTGIGLAMVCAEKGIPFVCVMSEVFSIERRQIMRAMGAKVILAPGYLKGTGLVQKAMELAEKHGWWMALQFDNPDNSLAHEETTAIELLEDFPPNTDMQLDAFVCGYGTGGTMSGVSKVLPNTHFVLCEPDNNPLVKSGTKQEIDEIYHREVSNPLFKPHPIQGWVSDFIPKLLRDSLDRINHVQPVNGKDAMNMALNLAKKEGIFTGVSGGGAVAGAIRFAETLLSSGEKLGVEGRPLNICAIVADTGERYLSTLLFDDVPVDMSPEEISIFNSTPLGQVFPPSSTDSEVTENDMSSHSIGNRTATAAEESPAPPPDLNPKAKKYVEDILANNKVVMFSLEWCEFCHSVTKFFKAVGLDFYTMPLDSASNMKDNWGIEVRKVTSSMTGCMTIPQIFIGGTFVGGAMDVMKGYRDGSLKPTFVEAGLPYDGSIDPEAYLPNWVSKTGT